MTIKIRAGKVKCSQYELRHTGLLHTDCDLLLNHISVSTSGLYSVDFIDHQPDIDPVAPMGGSRQALTGWAE